MNHINDKDEIEKIANFLASSAPQRKIKKKNKIIF